VFHKRKHLSFLRELVPDQAKILQKSAKIFSSFLTKNQENFYKNLMIFFVTKSCPQVTNIIKAFA